MLEFATRLELAEWMPLSNPSRQTPNQRLRPPAPTSPTQPQPTAPAETALEHEVRIATRNGRWALIAALCAAIVSGAVSAGSAI